MLARKKMKTTTKLLTTFVRMTLVSPPTYFISCQGEAQGPQKVIKGGFGGFQAT